MSSWSVRIPGSLTPLATAYNRIMDASKHEFQCLAKPWIINERFDFFHLTGLPLKLEKGWRTHPPTRYASKSGSQTQPNASLPVQLPVNYQNARPHPAQPTSSEHCGPLGSDQPWFWLQTPFIAVCQQRAGKWRQRQNPLTLPWPLLT